MLVGISTEEVLEAGVTTVLVGGAQAKPNRLRDRRQAVGRFLTRQVDSF